MSDPTANPAPAAVPTSDPVPAPVPDPAPAPPEIDRSSTVKIFNNIEDELRLVEHKAIHGYWSIDPPQKIGGIKSGNNKADFLLKDNLGPQGSEGKVVYASSDGKTYFTFNFYCKTFFNNTASGTPSAGNPYVRTHAFSTSGALDVTFSVNH